jgi:hypothetical protein
MTTHIEVPGLVPDDEREYRTDPAELRTLARDKRAEKAQLELRAMTLAREADQAEHEAGLWEAAEAAEAVWRELKQKTAGLEAAEEGTLAAERTAQDKLREDRRHLARRKGEMTRAESGTSREAKDEPAVRLSRAQQGVAGAEQELAAATKDHETAEAALDANRNAVREAIAAWQRALEAGYNPGVAPRSSPLRPGIGRVEHMTTEERDYAALLAITMGAAGSAGGSREEPRRNRVTTRGELAGQDPNGFRYIRTGAGVSIVPPDWRGTGRP